MALCDLLKNTIHEKRDSDSEHQSVHRARQMPILLFQDEHRERVDSLVTGAAAQMNGNMLELSSSRTKEYDELFVVISPATSKRTTPVPPNAPVKPRRLFSKVGLKPKKLHFVDKERNDVATWDNNCDDKRAIKSAKANGPPNERNGETRCSTRVSESKERLGHVNLNAMLQNLQLDATNDKENRRYGKEQYDRKARTKDQGRSVPMRTERAKTTRSQSSGSSNNGNSNSGNRMTRSSARQDCASQGLTKSVSVLSQCNDKLSWQEKLLWLQKRRDVGMMIQCCRKNCKKWRYCDDYHDPMDVPRIWYCEMNSDKSIASCLVSQVSYSMKFEQDLIENKYNAGSIVWARINGYPWWPAMVDDCPETLRYYELRESCIIPIKYHVIFFKQHLQHVWLKPYRIKPFIKYQRNKLVRKSVYYGVDYKEQLEKAYALAHKASQLSIFHRLQVFSYVSRLRKLQALQDKSQIDVSLREIDIVDHDQKDDDDNDDDDNEIIPGTPMSHITLKQFYDSVKSSMGYSDIV